MLFEANFTKLTDDQYLTALAWGIAALQDAGDSRTLSKEQGLFTKANPRSLKKNDVYLQYVS